MGSLPQAVQRVLGRLPPGVVKALEEVPRAAFLPAHLAALAGADAPLPFHAREGAVAVTPSPRALALLLQALEVEPGARVLVVGADSGYLGALCAAAGAARVRVVEPDREVADAAEGFLQASPFAGRVEVAAGPPAREAGEAPWDRILLLDPRRTLGPGLAARLGELGFALAVAHTAKGHELVRTVRAGEEVAELRFTELRVDPGLPEGPGSFLPEAARRTAAGVLAVEDMAQNVWHGRAPSRVETELRAGVEDTWRLAPEAEAAMPPATRERRALAKAVFHLGFLHQAAGDLDAAGDLYQRSAAVLPTAEAHTFLGWVRAYEGRLEEAIACCHKAIDADPTLGNPYNDIGAYLVQLGRPSEARSWLERALAAPRYEAPFFPHLNLARVHLALGDEAAARTHLDTVLQMRPGYAPAEELRRQLDGGARP